MVACCLPSCFLQLRCLDENGADGTCCYCRCLFFFLLALGCGCCGCGCCCAFGCLTHLPWSGLADDSRWSVHPSIRTHQHFTPRTHSISIIPNPNGLKGLRQRTNSRRRASADNAASCPENGPESIHQSINESTMATKTNPQSANGNDNPNGQTFGSITTQPFPKVFYQPTPQNEALVSLMSAVLLKSTQSKRYRRRRFGSNPKNDTTVVVVVSQRTIGNATVRSYRSAVVAPVCSIVLFAAKCLPAESIVDAALAEGWAVSVVEQRKDANYAVHEEKKKGTDLEPNEGHADSTSVDTIR